MSEKKIVVPEGMLRAAKDKQSALLDFMLEEVLEASLRELREILYLERENSYLLRRILEHLNHHIFSIDVTLENQMAISVGTTGTFTAQLEDNGNPISLPSGSTFAWTADDTNATLTPSSDSTSVVVSIPATDTATSITITASTTAPNGSTVSGSVTVPITPGVAHTFTVLVSQTV